MNNSVIEVVIMQSKNEISEIEVSELSKRFGTALKQETKVKGFIKRSFTKHLKEDKWVEMIWWENMECAKAALEIVPMIPEFQQYCAAFYEEDEMFYLEEKDAVSNEM